MPDMKVGVIKLSGSGTSGDLRFGYMRLHDLVIYP